MFNKQLAMIVFALCVVSTYAQVKIEGHVYNEYLEPFYNAKITKGNAVTESGIDGSFSIELQGEFPQVLTISAFGHQTELVEVSDANQDVYVILKENLFLDQVVVSASRVPERIIESPVTIERFGLTDIKRNTSNSFYDGLVNLKGVQSRETSYGFKSLNTRGFSDFSNSRFVQLVDGMDTAAPALNFSAGNLSGVSELDILNVEILPGASSALYGANAYNGILIMNTKNPFDHTGISTQVKGGFTSQEVGGDNPFYDVSVRMGYKFTDWFAAKVNFSYFETEEWHANDDTNTEIDTNELIEGTISDTFDYNGINTYGDEVFSNISSIANVLSVSFPTGILVNRTGYAERELVRDYIAKNLKFSGAFYFRPFKDESLEIQLASRIAMGDNIFQGTSRFSQRNYYIGQSKLEVKGDNFYVRGYYTRNDAGDTYDLTRTGIELSNSSSLNNTFGSWGYDYLVGLFQNGIDVNNLTADPAILEAARAYADTNRITPGTEEFDTEFNRITSTLITEGGSKIYDRSAYVHVDGNYNFSSLLNNWADIQVGGSFREYSPESRGTIFNDGTEPIRVNEYGFYTQIQKKLFDERLKLTGSVRYDKSQNFEGNYSPRFAVNYALGEEKGHILRASYQTGFRNPTIQEQYILLQTGRKINVGSSADNLSRIELENTNPGATPSVTTGDDIINNAFLTRSVYDPTYTGERFLKSEYEAIKPEIVQTIELGYRSMFNVSDATILDIDVNGFYSIHKDFVFFQDVVVPNYGTVIETGVVDADASAAFASGHVREFNLMTNSKSEVTSYGFGIGLHTKFFTDFDFGLNYNFIDFEYEDKDFGLFEPNFNTSKHTVKAQLGNNNVFKNFGFNVSGRWLDAYRWVSPFVKGDVDARTVLDAQLNYRIPSMKSKFKVGGTNLLGKEYFVAPGSGAIGKLYYISWIINN